MSYKDFERISFPGLENSSLVGIGWCTQSSDLTTDRPQLSVEFFSKMVDLSMDPWQPLVAAGPHFCEFCLYTRGPSQIHYNGKDVEIGVNNVFIPGDDFVFVAPSLILHYMDSHGYHPPPEFQEAVLRCPKMKSAAYFGSLKRHNLQRRVGSPS